MRLFSSFILVFFFSKVPAQSIQLEYGGMAFLSKIEQKIPNTIENYDNTNSFLTFIYRNKLKNNFFVSLGYTQYRPGVAINFSKDPNANILNFGTGAVLCRNFISGVEYERKISKRVFISSAVFIHFSKSQKQLISDWDHNFGLYQGVSSEKVYEKFQLLPDFRLSIGIRFLKRYNFFVTGGYLFGFTKIQDLIFEYSLNGVPQPTGINYTTGTNYHVGLGLKYDFKK